MTSFSIVFCGAAAVSKTDWSCLSGRQVVVWPDNDGAGLSASDDVCSELRTVGAKSVSIVDKDILSRLFPEKWDLADPVPAGKSSGVLRDMILMSKQKSIDVSQVLLGLGYNTKGGDPTE